MSKAVRRIGGWADRTTLAVLFLLSAYPPIRLAAQDTLPVGYGTLKRDDIVVRFATDQIAIQVLPLAQGVIRLLAPDTYASLRQLLKTKEGEIDAAAQRAGVLRPTLVMVTFFGVVPQARFSPRSEEHTSELQSPCNLVCRLLLEKKKKNTYEVRLHELPLTTHF